MLLILLPLLDQRQVVVFEFVQVLLQLVGQLESQLVLFVRVIFLEEWLKRFRVLNFELSKKILLRILLRICSPTLCRDRASPVLISQTSMTGWLSNIRFCLALKTLLFQASRSSYLFGLDKFFRPEIVEEFLVSVVSVQLLQTLVNLALQGCTLVIDMTQCLSFLVALFLGCFKLRSSLAGLIFYLCKELQEALSVGFEHFFRTDETNLPHLIEISQSIDLLVFLFEQHLDQEHLSLLFDQIPSILSVLRSLNGDIEPSSLCDVDLVSDVRINGKRSWLDVCFAELAETAFASWTILLPDLQLPIRHTLAFLANALFILECEDLIVTRVSERIFLRLKTVHRVCMLANSSALVILVSTSRTKTRAALVKLTHQFYLI